MNTIVKKVARIAKVCVPLISFLISLYVLIMSLLNQSFLYNAIWMWPLAFFVFSIFIYSPFARIKDEHLFGLSLIVGVELIPRYILYPLIVVQLPNYYQGIIQVPLTKSEIDMAVIYAVVELLVLGFFIFILERNYSRKMLSNPSTTENRLILRGNKWVYLIYLLLAFLIYILIGRHYNIIQFMTMSSGFEVVQENKYIALLKYIMSTALAIAILLIISVAKTKYDKNENKIYAYFALFCSVVYTGFIVGISRSMQIALGMLVCIILLREFPKLKNTIIVFMVIATGAVVLSVTTFRTGSGKVVGDSLEGFANQLQIYFGGPASIAQGINVLASRADINISNAFFDFLRSCFPLNLLLKDKGSTISQLYNLSLYHGLYNHGQIVFGSSYGYVFLGILGVPLMICLNCFLALKSSEIFYRSRSYEVMYLSGYCLIRLLAATLVNTPTILGTITQYLGTFGLLIWVSKHIK